MMPSIDAARSARVDLQRKLDEGELPVETGIRFHEARERFVESAREGRALNKHGHRYKRRALDDIEECLRVHAEPRLGSKRLSQIRRGDVQAIVDELAPTMSGSRVRSVVNAIRSLYRWAQDRDLANHDPAALARLPAMDATAIERVASPAEFAGLLAALPTEDALPYALACYGMARLAQIVRVRWQDVDLNVGAIEWGVEWEARKYEASRRVVPTVPPLLALLKRAYLEQGRPDGSQLVCPPRYVAKTGVLSAPGLAQRAAQRLEGGGVAADHLAGGAAHRGHVAGRRRRVAQGRLVSDGPFDAGPAVRCRGHHAAQVHAHAAGGHRTGAGDARPIPRRQARGARGPMTQTFHSAFPRTTAPRIQRGFGHSAPVSKTGKGLSVLRGFESPPLR